MNQTPKLTLEQEFRLAKFACEVKKMTLQQAQEFLIEQHRTMLIEKIILQQLLTHEFNLDIDTNVVAS